MKKFLLSIAAVAALSTAANAQETYNYFDPADCDANGWLWFDTQEKLEKYCGFTDEFKIQLLSATFENEDGEYVDCSLDGEIKGYNKDGVQGGEGSWTGAIILSPGSTGIGLTSGANGGGIMLWLPDCAEFSLALSQEANAIQVSVMGVKGWGYDIDANIIKTFCNMGFISKPLANEYQYDWLNIQNLENLTGVSCPKLQSPKGEQITGIVRQNKNVPLLVQGIKLFTYTQTEYPENGAGVEDIIGDDANAPVEYFNLQGLKVNGDEPGIYIRRQGAKTSKVLVK